MLNPVRAFCEGFPWLGAVFLLGLAGYQLGGVRLAALVAALTAFCAVTGLWEKTMATVYLCGISAFIACLIGIPLGLAASRSDRFEKIITPVIDTLQVLPSFCFIIPVVMLFRVGDVTAMIATVAFAVVPAIRYTNHGIRQVPPALIEAAVVSGCTKRQTFWRVQLPLALPEIMLGINQTILMALAMIIICAMIGTRDLGQEVFIALSKADSGRGIVAGLAIAFIGIVADRLFGAWSAKAQGETWGRRHLRTLEPGRKNQMTATPTVEACSPEWIAAFNAHDLDRHMQLYTEDAILFGSVDELQNGRETIQGLFRRAASWRPREAHIRCPRCRQVAPDVRGHRGPCATSPTATRPSPYRMTWVPGQTRRQLAHRPAPRLAKTCANTCALPRRRYSAAHAVLHRFR